MLDYDLYSDAQSRARLQRRGSAGDAVGTIVSGQPYSRAEVYQSGVVTLPLQQTDALNCLHAMNAALAKYSDRVCSQSGSSAKFIPFEPMPGNSFDAKSTSACWK